MFKRIILFFVLMTALHAESFNADYSYTKDEIKKMIGSMLIVGFDEESVSKESEIYRYIKQYDLGGVILFDRFYREGKKVKNIRNPRQLQKLTAQLQSISKKNLIISVDQEGGPVARLKKKYGFGVTPGAAEIGKKDDPEFAEKAYRSLARELSDNGINCDFAPVVDLSVNPENNVIVKRGRSFGRSPEKVTQYATIFIDELKKEGIISVLKHFPGHGSSLGDSHEGFVDISDTWTKRELQPYKELIKANKADMIMTAHVFNRKLDDQYPATLSYNINTKLLRNKMGYQGVIISDDMQMKAIAKQYSLKESVTLAINSGVDILLFGNQLGLQYIDKLITVIYEQIDSGAIKLSTIIASNKRISALHKKYEKSL